ncbi:rab3 GTPase-activating protein catalytic subunit isoform X1 [Polypterus senegalus]|uniref:rab3 GTPase-activating protein catalytic subunit isoform X1 n=1 Tax=Polypterus senegalus TaxID=55291 RepID=UPI0019656A8F|nr:rab3 GTPase-activating protein catalytic subunit isoform X1 [Polypterus senegalus]
MAADSDPESDVFEITDFTTASEWERFISRVEEVLNEWKLIGTTVNKKIEKGEYTSGTWEEKTVEISFADFKFSITHHYLKQELSEKHENEDVEEDAFPSAMQDLLCMNNDFPPRAHCLVRWYGIREFVVISPSANSDAVISESKCNLLLSSISISLGNTGCQVPLFVQIQQKWRRMYVGECQGPGVRTDFEMVHLRKVPNQYNHLSGLLDVFKSKISCPLTHLPPINISIRFTYILQDWQQYSWPQQPPDFDTLLSGEVGGVEFGKLPFGACEDPISELHLSTTWPQLSEGIVVDNDVYSDLDPVQAPHWSVRVRKAENPQCLLGDFLHEFFKLCCRKESTEEILGRSSLEDDGKENNEISHALSKLTEPTTVPIPKLSVSNMVHSARKRMRRRRRVEESPLSNEVLNSILLYLFPDAADKHIDAVEAKQTLNTDHEDYRLYNQFKSSPADSLTYKLALCLCLVNFYHGGVKGVAHLWQEFVLEMRYRWENNILITGLAGGPPDLRCCLLHQKLQMLNCCIDRKKARDDGKRSNSTNSGLTSGTTERKVSNSENGKVTQGVWGSEDRKEKGEVAQGKSWDSWSDSEDEFFECLSDTEELKENVQDRGKDGTPKDDKEGSGCDTHQQKAEGRLYQHAKLTLLHTGEPLYIPVTQEPAPMTEDLLEEQSEVLAKLGTSAEGAHLRARMQSACLLSDMESFKAANPGCCLEDFVRWYSPRDYVEEVFGNDGKAVTRGELSARMKIPGNMWVEAWETAKPSPARRQRRLFDDTREAEKVLHYLAVQKPADLTQHLLPCIIHAAILKVKEEEFVENIASVRKEIQQIVSHASKLLRHPNSDYKKLEEIINEIMAVETVIARARSLKAKFGIGKCEEQDDKEELEKFVISLLEEPEVTVIGAGRGPAGRIIHKLFVNAQRLAESTDEAAVMTPLDDEPGKLGSAEERKPNLASNSEFPSPAGREVILRAVVSRPAPYSRPLPQRMFCVLMKDDFRLAGAFAADTSFF